MKLVEITSAQIKSLKNPPYGEPGSYERRVYIAWETNNTIQDKVKKLASLKERGLKDSDVNWNREWEADTRVRSYRDAENEIKYFRNRLAQALLTVRKTGRTSNS
jgi:hypothetical protein